jgi:ribosomal protein S18 acetylase RimI-like enzyme
MQVTRVSDEIEVVQASAENLYSVASLFDQYRVFYGQASDWSAAQHFILDRFNSNDSVIYLALAQANDAALGFVQLYPSFSSISMKPLWILNDLFVAPKARNKGIARRLMDRARKLAIGNGSKGLVLETAVENRAAQLLYEDLGYLRNETSFRYYLQLES